MLIFSKRDISRTTAPLTTNSVPIETSGGNLSIGGSFSIAPFLRPRDIQA